MFNLRMVGMNVVRQFLGLNVLFLSMLNPSVVGLRCVGLHVDFILPGVG